MHFITQHLLKSIVITLLLVLCVLSWYAAAVIYRNNKENILLYLADVTDTIVFPYKVARLAAQEEVSQLPMPLLEVTPAMTADTWGAARSEGRTHEGVDIFAMRGTPVFSTTKGYVMHTGQSERGGTIVFIMGPGGIRYYYAHLHRIATGIEFGSYVTADTVIGFVGNTGNASTTAPHLHFGVYTDKGPVNPHPLLIAR